MSASAAAQCATAAASWSLLVALREAAFYVGVAILWVLVIQWNMIDRWLGSPGASHYLLFQSIHPVLVRSGTCDSGHSSILPGCLRWPLELDPSNLWPTF